MAGQQRGQAMPHTQPDQHRKNHVPGPFQRSEHRLFPRGAAGAEHAQRLRAGAKDLKINRLSRVVFNNSDIGRLVGSYHESI